MKARQFLRSFAIVGALVFVVTSIVSYLYSLIVHGAGVVDWESSIRFAIIFGIVLSFRFGEPGKTSQT